MANFTRYPMHVKLKTNQSFAYMNLAISLSLDLGLDNQIPNQTSFNMVNPKGLVENGLFTVKARQTYLGCYYLSSK